MPPFHCLTRHSPNHAGGLVLGDRKRAGGLHKAQRFRTIVTHAGKQYANCIGAGGLGHRFEQYVDRRFMPIDLRPIVELATKTTAIADNPQMPAARSQLSMATQNRLAILGFADCNHGILVESLGESLAKTTGDMLTDDDTGNIIGQLADDILDCLGTAG